ncbi:cobalamin-independent methionine synthase catalytic subunit [Pseudonocardia autotrophica]|uniref:Cobalamin-independent synthase, Catalytic domain n=2 Tax=Pseudonocardia TaxID=1847 RepID=A0A1Y2N946_PSEAH|nr:Cobalamin-independent synthase, Catalytic domain [Pseudonocardia autotrophica]TDN73422.1 cobalamin-independent methionine synthase catalytic subunit [Pseudonocardia autotrophica]BBG04161.1 methionine synthase [Pseudonocardia autotrophica]GEC25492.1 methionine synthase [Pseudonocardia saturnea]
MSSDDPLAAALAAAGLGDVRPGESRPPEPRIEVVDAAPEEPAAPRGLLPAGIATGVGSLPGTDPRESSALVVGETPDLPALPELPERGVGADMIGRTAALLVDIAVEVVPSGWRVTARPGRDLRRGRDLMAGDLDAFDDACDHARPDWVKIQVAGPWTLAAAVELASGHRVLTDRGAVREFAASLGEGLRAHVAEIGERTGAKVVVQLDEPGLPAVIAGSLPTASGYGTVRAVRAPDAQDALRDLISSIDAPVVVHCCADRPPIRLLAGAGAAAVGIDATGPAFAGSTAEPAALDAIGETWDTGTPLMLGLVPSTAPRREPEIGELARAGFELADRLGFDRHRLTRLAVPTPACGLAGATPDWARRALTLSRDLGRAFADPDE